MAIESKPIAASHARPVRNEASRAASAGAAAPQPASAFSSLLEGFGAEEASTEGDAAAGDSIGAADVIATPRAKGKGAPGIAAADGLPPDAAAVALAAAQMADTRPVPPPAGSGGSTVSGTAPTAAATGAAALPAIAGATGAGAPATETADAGAGAATAGTTATGTADAETTAAGTLAPGVLAATGAAAVAQRAAAEAGRAAAAKADASAAGAAPATATIGNGTAGAPLQGLDASRADGMAARPTATVAGAAAGIGTTADGAAAGKTSAGLAGFTSILAQMQHAFARNSAARDAGTAGAADTLGMVATGTATGAAGTLSGLAARSGIGSAAADMRDALRPGADPVRGFSAADLLPLAPAGADTPRGGHGASDRPADSAPDAATTAGFGLSGTGDAAAWRGVSAADASATAVQDGTAQLSAEDRLADQVGYWVNQKTQSAALTLDAFGGVPVEVRISLTGSDAQVSFRSDQADARALLGSAEADLREMLQKEGLNLAGLSIGGSEARGAAQSGNGNGGSGSGQGRDGSREGRGGRPGGVSAVDRVAAGGTVRAPAGAVAGRALDLFV